MNSGDVYGVRRRSYIPVDGKWKMGKKRTIYIEVLPSQYMYNI